LRVRVRVRVGVRGAEAQEGARVQRGGAEGGAGGGSEECRGAARRGAAPSASTRDILASSSAGVKPLGLASSM